MGQLAQYKNDFTLLLETGFIASHQADEDAAKKLFKASHLLNPESSLPRVGDGYLHFLKLELKQAITSFEEVLKTEPGNGMAKALLGLSIAFTTKNVEQGEKLLQEAKKSTSDTSIINMAKSGLEFIDKYIKKAPSPVESAATPPKKKESKKKS